MKNSLRFTFAAAVMAAASFAPLQAQAGLFDDDEARKAILDIRAKIDGLRRDMESRVDQKADKNSTLDLLSQNEQMRQEIARLRGQVEVLTNEVSNAQQRQKDFYVDLDTRLRKVEPQKVNIDGREASVDQAEQKSYDAALALFKAGDYKTASASFADFLRRYPTSAFAAPAQYWLGNSHYALRDYRSAVEAQQSVVRNYPDSPKAPDALLNMASSFMELKDRTAARKSLEALIQQYPDAPAAQTARDRLANFK
jgi:tol-pal system protein YbgF